MRVKLGTFAVDWSMTETDGLPGAPADQLEVGAEWQWYGQAMRLDGPNDIFPLGEALEQRGMRDRVRARADRLVRLAVPPKQRARMNAPPRRPGFTVTDGQRAWRGDWVRCPSTGIDLAVFSGGLPPIAVPLWVIEIERPTEPPATVAPPRAALVLTGLAAGTPIATPLGPVPVETLHPGDPVLTRDHGPRPVAATTARFFGRDALDRDPGLRPLVIEHTAVNGPPWSKPIRVAPAHRLLVSGAQAEALFSQSEVLAEASHLEDRIGVSRDLACYSVEYHTISLAAPGMISAGGHWCDTAPVPQVDTGTDKTGREQGDYDWVAPIAAPDAPRRVLTAPEAAILAAHG